MKIIFVFILSLLLCNQAISQPSYKIWSVLSNYNINLGDTVIFDVGLSGYGYINPKYTKITLYSDTTSKMFEKKYIVNVPYEILKITFAANAPNDFFNSPQNQTIIQKSDDSKFGSHIYSVPTTTGDKYIKIIATYSSDSLSWHTEESSLNFHVNTWYEEYEKFLVTFGLIFAFIAVFDPISNIYIKIKKKFIQKPELNNSLRKKQK